MSDWDARGTESRWAAGESADGALETRSRTDLLQIARARQVPDADLMRRDELVEALRKESPNRASATGSSTTNRAEPLRTKPGTDQPRSLEALSRGELVQAARARKIPGCGVMSRTALIAVLEDPSNAQPPITDPAASRVQHPATDAHQSRPLGPAPRGPRSPTPAVVSGVPGTQPPGPTSRPVKDDGANEWPSSATSSRNTTAPVEKGIRDSLPRKRALIPGALLCLALLGLGWAAASNVGETAASTTHTSVYTTTISGRIVTVNGKAQKIIVPAKTIHRRGKTVTIPAHTVAITDTQVLPGPTSTVDGTVVRTVRVPVTVTGPGTTATTTQTVTGPVTTVVQTVVSTEIGTTTVTVTETVTAPTTT